MAAALSISLRLVDDTLPVPAYQTPGAVAFDVYSRVDMEITPRSVGLIPTNLIIQVPDGYVLAVLPRSSTPKKKGLLIPHGFGVIDQDYHGSGDEILYQVYNFTDAPVPVARGERIGQAMFLCCDRGTFVQDLQAKESRGGFGTTGS